MTLRGGHIRDAAMEVILIIPLNKLVDPLPPTIKLEMPLWIARAILQGTKKALNERVIIANTGAAQGRHDLKALKSLLERRARHRRSII
jgi:hypothetical protein